MPQENALDWVNRITGVVTLHELTHTFAILAPTAGLLGVALVGGVTPAVASSDCVTKHEFKKVKRGMSRERVARIFDTDGRLQLRSGQLMSRKYDACARFAVLSVDYKRGRVRHKLGIWP